MRLESLANIINKHKFRANFIKVDTDGFDFKVLRSAKEYLAESKPSLFFEWDKEHLEVQGEDYLSIFSLLEECGYKDLVIFDNFGSMLCVLNVQDSLNLRLLMEYVERSSKNIYYYDVFVLGGGLGLEEFLAEF